jgi:hypothetical protein
MQSKFKILLKTTWIVLLSSLFATLVVGYQPFVTNYKNHKTPFYPIYVDKTTGDSQYNFNENRPSNYVDENQISLFAKSIFFRTNGYFAAPEDVAGFKIPFSFNRGEVLSYVYLGPKIGAMGIFFSGIVLLCSIMTLSWFFKKNSFITPDFKYSLKVLLFCLAVVIISCIINPLNSSYRYIPQVWLIIPLIVLFSFKFRSQYIFVFNLVIIILALLNSFIVFKNTSSFNWESAKALDSYLTRLSLLSQKSPLIINFAQAEGNEFLLERYRINFQADQEQSSGFQCPDGLQKRSLLNKIGNSSALVCLSTEDSKVMNR